jgi:hypothetical protein
MYARYIRIMDEKPGEDIAVTIEQLTAMRHVLDSGRAPYADFSVWGPHGVRIQKRNAPSGAAMDTKGIMHDIEMYGPPTLEAWLQSYGVLETAFIMMDTVSRPNLAAYKKLIMRLGAQYGPKVWHLLYQADVRCRQELMEATQMELFVDYNTALALNQPTTFQPSRPWDSVWAAVLKNSDWWKIQFETPALLVLTHTANLDSMVEGDAQVASGANSSHQGHAGPATASQVGKPRKAGKPKPVGPQKVGQDGNMASNRKGKQLCQGFQNGSCRNSIGTTNVCVVDGVSMHQCARCLATDHGCQWPKECTATQAQPKVKGAGKKKGNSKGSKSFGKGKGNWK